MATNTFDARRTAGSVGRVAVIGVVLALGAWWFFERTPVTDTSEVELQAPIQSGATGNVIGSDFIIVNTETGRELLPVISRSETSVVIEQVGGGDHWRCSIGSLGSIEAMEIGCKRVVQPQNLPDVSAPANMILLCANVHPRHDAALVGYNANHDPLQQAKWDSMTKVEQVRYLNGCQSVAHKVNNALFGQP